MATVFTNCLRTGICKLIKDKFGEEYRREMVKRILRNQILPLIMVSVLIMHCPSIRTIEMTYQRAMVLCIL